MEREASFSQKRGLQFAFNFVPHASVVLLKQTEDNQSRQAERRTPMLT